MKEFIWGYNDPKDAITVYAYLNNNTEFNVMNKNLQFEATDDYYRVILIFNEQDELCAKLFDSLSYAILRLEKK